MLPKALVYAYVMHTILQMNSSDMNSISSFPTLQHGNNTTAIKDCLWHQ